MVRKQKHTCSDCEWSTENLYAMGGHKSSHARKNKQSYTSSLRDIECKNCKKVHSRQSWNSIVFCDWACRKEYMAGNKGRTVIFNLEKRDIDEYIARVSLCEICGNGEKANTRPELKTTKNKLCRDHNHSNNNFRGALCYSCNVKLGWYEKLSAEINNYLEVNNDFTNVKIKMGI